MGIANGGAMRYAPLCPNADAALHRRAASATDTLVCPPFPCSPKDHGMAQSYTDQRLNEDEFYNEIINNTAECVAAALRCAAARCPRRRVPAAMLWPATTR